MSSMPFCPPAAMRLGPNDAYASAHPRQHAAAPGAGGGGSEPAAAAAAAAVGRSARPMLSGPDAPLALGLGTHTAPQPRWTGPAPTPPDTGGSLRPDQVAEAQYLASRARGRLGSGPLW